MELRTWMDVPLARSNDGVVYVGGTRVALETLVEAFNQGGTAEEITQQFDALSLADVYAAIGYYLRHREEVDAYLRVREACRVKIRADNEERFGIPDLRERLLARRTKQ